MSRQRLLQLLWFVVAAGCLVGASMLRSPLDRVREEHDLVPPGNPVAQNHPGYALLTVAPGGLRAPIVNYLWIRAEELKQAGRFYEAMQLSDVICQLMPRFPGVWDFHSWNMTWNISVATHTPEERWMWVYNGVELLRDRGIPMNPKALGLYKSLGMIFFSKMGQATDEMHMVYKRRWAYRMQSLLGTPPPGQTSQVIDAFKLVADESLVDKDRRRQGRDVIQADRLAKVLAGDEAAAAYAVRLKKLGVAVGQDLLDAYNRFSRDDGLETIRVGRVPAIKTDADKALSQLINDASPLALAGRTKLLSFVRAQILWNEYKMDPRWMLHLMQQYNVPLDWRLVQAHGLYWETYGLEQCGAAAEDDIEALNTKRIILNSFKALTWNGRLTYIENPRDPQSPAIGWGSDWRFIEPTHKAHIELAKVTMAAEQASLAEGGAKITFAKNRFRAGHVNYLTAGINMLYAGYRRELAQHYLDYMQKTYILENRGTSRGDMWTMDLDEFVLYTLEKDGEPIPDVVNSQLKAAIVASYEQLALGNRQGYIGSINYAQRIYHMHQRGVPKRKRFPPLRDIVAGELSLILVAPGATGMYMNLESRHKIYVGLNSELQVRIYDRIAPSLKNQCANAQPPLDFDKSFPVPPGLEAYRAAHRRSFSPSAP